MRFRMVWFGLLLCLVLHSARQQEDEQEQEPRVRQQTRPLTLLSFVNPPAASCNPSEWGQFFMVPSRDLDPVVMLQRPERSASAGGKLCLRVRAVQGRTEGTNGSQSLHLVPLPRQKNEHCSMNPDPASELFTFHLRNLNVGGWGYVLQIVYRDDLLCADNGTCAQEEGWAEPPSAACWVVVGRMASPPPFGDAIRPAASPLPAAYPLPHPMSVEEALLFGRKALRTALMRLNETPTQPPPLLPPPAVASVPRSSGPVDELSTARHRAEWIARTADEMVRSGHSTSSLTSSFHITSSQFVKPASSELQEPSFAHVPAANLYFEASSLAPKLAAALVAIPQNGMPMPSAASAATADCWNEFEAESLHQRCEGWRNAPSYSKEPWLDCLREGCSRWPQHPIWSFELGRALLLAADSEGEHTSRTTNEGRRHEACAAFESAAAAGNYPHARLHVAFCDEVLRDDSSRAVALLRAAALDAIYRGEFSTHVNDSLAPSTRPSEVSMGALLLRLATTTPRIIASPMQPADLVQPTKVARARIALQSYRVALAHDLACLVSIGGNESEACGSSIGRVTRLLADVCGEGWWSKARTEPSGEMSVTSHNLSIAGPCSFYDDVRCPSNAVRMRKRVLLCNPSRGACANPLTYASIPKPAATLDGGRDEFCRSIMPPNEGGESCSWPPVLRLGNSESILQQSLSLGFFLAFHGSGEMAPTDAHLKHLLGRSYRCLASASEVSGAFTAPSDLSTSLQRKGISPAERKTQEPGALAGRPPWGQRVRARSVNVAVVSRFLHRHSVGLLMVGVLEDIAENRPPQEERDLEIHIFSTNPSQHQTLGGGRSIDPISARIRAVASSFTRLPTDDLLAARRIILSHLDPLSFDVALYPELGMDPTAYFLSQGRLAAVQIAWWGHPDSSGSPSIDYFVAGDSFIDAQRGDEALAAERFSEQLVRFECLGTKFDDGRVDDTGGNDAALESTAVAVRARLLSVFEAAYASDMGELLAFDEPKSSALDNGTAERRLYLCVQSFFKWHPRFLSKALLPILRADPQAVVVAPLPSNRSGHAAAWSRRLREAVAATAAEEIVIARAGESGRTYEGGHVAIRHLAARVLFVPRVASSEMPALFRAADAVLDTFPFGGGVTSLQAMAAGVAPVTLPEPGAWSGQLTLSMYHQLAVAVGGDGAKHSSFRVSGPRDSSVVENTLGLFEACVARDAVDYAQKAVRLAKDAVLRQQLRAVIREHAQGALFNDKRAAREWARFLYGLI